MTRTTAYPPLPGFTFTKLTKDGLWGIWAPVKQEDRFAPKRVPWQHKQVVTRQPRQQAEAQQRPVALSPVERDHAYRQLLSQLSLDDSDRSNLLQRGLTESALQFWGVKSVDRGQLLSEPLSPQVPGVSANGQHLHVAQPGYLCPVIDVDGCIVACQIRLRQAKAGRYRWLSSRQRQSPAGPSPHLPNGELPLTVMRPPVLRQSTLGMCEGLGPKPLIIAQRFGQIVIGAAGAHFGGSHKTLQDTLTKLTAEGHTKTIDFYVDAGAVQNENVLRQYRQTWELLHQWAYTVRIVWWGQSVKGETLDADELTDHSAIQFITIAAFEAIAQQNQKQPPLSVLEDLKGWMTTLATRRRSHSQGFQKTAPKPAQLPQQSLWYNEHTLPRPGTTVAPNHIRFRPGQRLQLLQDLVQNGWKHILDLSPPSLGKSYDAGIAESEALDCTRLFYLSETHRNPTTATVERNYTDMPVRHNGMVVDTSRQTQLGTPYTRWPQQHELPNTPGNCSQTAIFEALQAKHIVFEGAANPVCGACPQASLCSTTVGPGYGHRHERQRAFQATRIRLHPDSAPDPATMSLAQTGAFWDEALKILCPTRTITVHLADFDQVMADLETQQPVMHAELRRLRTVLRPLLNGVVRQPHYGWNDPALGQLVGNMPEALNQLITQLLQTTPDLTESLETPDGLALDGIPVHEQPALKRVDTLLRQQSEQESLQRLAALPLQWLLPFLQVWGQLRTGALRVENQQLLLTVQNQRHSHLAQSCAWNVYQDATATPTYLALHLGIQLSDIIVIEQFSPEPEHLEVVQITGLGQAGRHRSALCKQRIAALKAKLYEQHPDLAVIDFKDQVQAGEGWWFNHNRGSNEFEHRSAIVSFGIPYPNVGAAFDRYQTLTGRPLQAEDKPFQDYLQWLTQAEIRQAVGRLRAPLRPQEKLTYYFCADYELPESLKANLVSAQTIAIEAGTVMEQTLHRIREAFSTIMATGEDLTQKSMARLSGLSQGRISQIFNEFGGWKRCKEILVSLLNPTDRAANKALLLDAGTQWFVTLFLPTLVEEPPEQVVQAIRHVISVCGARWWQQLLTLIDWETRVKLLVAFLHFLPPGWQTELTQLLHSVS